MDAKTVRGLRDWLIIAAAISLLLFVMNRSGVIVWYKTETPHFWFEPALKRWIHGK